MIAIKRSREKGKKFAVGILSFCRERREVKIIIMRRNITCYDITKLIIAFFIEMILSVASIGVFMSKNTSTNSPKMKKRKISFDSYQLTKASHVH